MEFELKHTLEVANTLGEGVVWDHAAQCVWWTDIEGCKLFRYYPASEELNTFDTPERLCCLSKVFSSSLAG